ncbi:DUF2842 domain-containing protein [Sphingomonas sp. Leaf257]|jgi:hypothetical protein|uniref:DUF2842 domain-containing protein n=1 Tax=Sphingomonas sp. Leaf257 TaxID=1736309 RepID=UPI0006F6FBA5|nr:DUF2842 domain-containing protein [Sphingomonas sp. Leaf257]KQO50748.1 hypothetical protein ASF14_11805 [Sphingomonas sp. Leaf257]
MTPSWRKPAGMLLIVAIIIVWAMLIASLSGVVGQWHWVLQLIFYVVAGIVWITPMKPLLRWMEGGRR